MTIDIHQHIWPPALIEALRSRSAVPRLRGWTLQLAGEPDHELAPADHDPAARAALAHRDGLDLALVSLSSPLGIESLPGDDGASLLGAYHDGALALGAPFRAWAAAGLARIDAPALARELDRGFVGLQLPATTLLDGPGYDRVAPLLDVLAQRDLPLFVHPGPVTPAFAPPAVAPSAAPAGAPSAAAAVAQAAAGTLPAWWPAIVDYVSQMHAAWFAFRALGRPRHPQLRVCFAMLAGLAPLHGERFAARAGQRTVIDDGAYLEISSYGPRAIDAVVRVLGIDGLVNGSDRPYAAPVDAGLGEAAQAALTAANPQRLLQGGVP